MDVFTELLESYSGRDSVIRAANYLSLYLSARTRGTKSLKLKRISEQLSYCRLILRLFDDLPMLRYTVTYGLGKEESSFLLRCLGVLKNIVDQVYYPIEHLAWAADMQLFKAKSETFSSISVGLWALSSYINIIRSLIVMSNLQKKTIGLKNSAIHEAIVKEQLELLLFAFKNVADVVMAVNYFPAGSLLWAGKLDTKQIGLCGFGIYVLTIELPRMLVISFDKCDITDHWKNVAMKNKKSNKDLSVCYEHHKSCKSIGRCILSTDK